MPRVAGVSPLSLRALRKVHVSTWAAALLLAGACNLAALYAGHRASLYLAERTVPRFAEKSIPPLAEKSVKPEQKTASRELNVAPETTETPNRAKKEAREGVRAEARLSPGLVVEGSVTPGATEPGGLESPDAWKPIAPESQDEKGAAGETGRASWYDLASATANGEEMDAGALTAAHRTLPFGTKVLVENLDNGRAVLVRINDRGPFAKDRIIDLSKEAAERLGMVADGVANVRVSPVADTAARVISASAQAAEVAH